MWKSDFVASVVDWTRALGDYFTIADERTKAAGQSMPRLGVVPACRQSSLSDTNHRIQSRSYQQLYGLPPVMAIMSFVGVFGRETMLRWREHIDVRKVKRGNRTE